MEILSLNIVNFRNFASRKIHFDNKLTLILGHNGAGKSNILEAISLLCGMRSERVDVDLDLIKFAQTDCKIEGQINSEEKHNLIVNMQSVDGRFLRKSYFVDQFKKRQIDLCDFLSMVIFVPADLDLVSGSPSQRRREIDNLLSSLDREYARNLLSYGKIVSRRNRVLNRIIDGKSKPMELDFWDERLLEHGKYISQVRLEFFEYLNFIEKGDSMVEIGDLSWQLKQSLLSREKLLQNRERDIAAGVTLSGPHRDDFRFIFKERDLAYFGSRGQMRMAVLALKIAELEYFNLKKGERPILALDDIFSELDWDHRKTVLSIISNQQTIVTAAEAESVPKEVFKRARVVEL